MSTKKTNTHRYWRNLSALDMAVIKQLTGGDGQEVDDEGRAE